MLPELALTSLSQSVSTPIAKPISIDIIRESIQQKLDSISFGLFHFKTIFICALLFITEGFEFASIFFQRLYYSQTSYMQQPYYDCLSKIWFLLGQTFGSFLFSITTLKKGRQFSFRLLIIIYCFSSFALYFIHNQERVIYKWETFIMMNAFRCLIGCFFGGFHLSVFSVIDEVIPKKWRGRVNMLLLGCFCPIGMLCFIFISYAFGLFSFSFSNQILNLSRLIPILFLFPLLFLDDLILSSPRLEMLIGRFRDAQKIMNAITHTEDNSTVVNSTRSVLSLNKRVIPNLMFNRNAFWSLDVIKCLHVQYKRFIYCISLVMMHSLYQYSFFPLINCTLTDQNKGFMSSSFSFFNSNISSFLILLQLLGGIAITLLLDLFKRQTTLIILISLMLISSVLLGFNELFGFIPHNCNVIPISIFLFSGSGLKISFSLVSELFPFRYRIQILCLANVVAQLIAEGCCFALIWNTVNNISTCFYFSYAGMSVITIAIIYKNGIDTRNIGLEQLTANIIMSEFTEIANISKI